MPKNLVEQMHIYAQRETEFYKQLAFIQMMLTGTICCILFTSFLKCELQSTKLIDHELLIATDLN